MATVFKCQKSGNVLLEKIVNGKSIRISTGKKATSRNIGWYKAHSEEEFWKYYYQKNVDDEKETITFREYSKMIVEVTSSNRNKFTQVREVQKQKTLSETFGDMQIDKILSSHIQSWQNEFLTKWAGKTCKEYRSTLNIVFEYAVNDDLIRKNPLKSVKAPKRKRIQVEVFEEKERQLLIENCDGQLKNIVKFTFFSGLRASEIIGLRWENIYLEENKINVCERVRMDDVDLPKGGKVRVIDLLPQAKESLLSQRQRTGLHNYVFLTRFNKPYYTSTQITESIKAICRKVGVKEGGLQKIRKSHNTMLKQLCLPNDWILHQMGHEEDLVNREYYTGAIRVELSQLEGVC